MAWWIKDTSFGQRLKLVRRYRCLTQKELGMMLGYPEKQADVRIAQYEKNSRTPKPDTVAQLAEILNVSPAVFSQTICASREDLIPRIELSRDYCLRGYFLLVTVCFFLCFPNETSR